MSGKSFVSGAIILMLAGFVVRILGFVYRIFLSNLIGAEGMGLFQLISPIYSLVILTLTAGISISVSRMVAEETARHHFVNLKRITRCALTIVIFAGVIVSVLIYLNINFIVKVILADTRTYYSLLLLIPCIPVIAAASALKGYFYGIQDVVPTAFSQIVEQVVRIGLVMLLAGHFVNAGLDYACALATIGMALGEIANLLVLYIVYRFKKTGPDRSGSGKGFLRKRIIMKELVKESVPISFNRFINSIMSTVEYLLIPKRFLAGGLDAAQSLAEFGKLTGMAMPLLFFPSLVTSSLATTLVPAISEAMSLKNFRAVNYRISKSVHITFILGAIFTAIFLSYPDQIGDLLYKREKIGHMLHIMAFSCVFIYLQQTLTGILNGLGKQGISLRNSIIGNSIRIAFVYVCIPVYGIQGYVWGMVISMACVCTLNLYTIMKTTGMLLDIRNWVIKPGIVCVFMLLISKYVYAFFEIFCTQAWLNMALTIAGNVGIGIGLMIVLGTLSREEVVRLIKGGKG